MDDCAICFEKLNKDPLYSCVQCEQSLHQRCRDQWVEKSKTDRCIFCNWSTSDSNSKLNPLASASIDDPIKRMREIICQSFERVGGLNHLMEDRRRMACVPREELIRQISNVRKKEITPSPIKRYFDNSRQYGQRYDRQYGRRNQNSFHNLHR